MWTAAALSSEARDYRGSVWRVVEAQHRISTMRITETLDEQALVEALIEETKPEILEAMRGLHFLLATPFRYRPHPYGSRFRRAGQREGVFYAAEHVETALAEIAFYRFLLRRDSPDAVPPRHAIELTVFSVVCATSRSVDLTMPPLVADRGRWTSPSDYQACHALADEARKVEIDMIRYESVRDRRDRANIAILSPGAFAERGPQSWESWSMLPDATTIRLWREFPSNTRYEFSQSDFTADARLARA
ncbi:MAG: RES domain-containing protein [Alphaproteobacteria bacterium]|nr:RES domain-containing protein [Alphaproteobacteria bacterium]